MPDQPQPSPADLPPELLEQVAKVLLASKIARCAPGYKHLKRDFNSPFPADYEDARAVAPLLIAHGREAGVKAMQWAAKAWTRGWQDIATAPYNTPVIIEVGSGMTFVAQLVPDASMNSEDQFCDQWRAVHQGEHPPCWSGGACWESNENDAISMQPRRWRALDPEEIVK